LIFSGIGESSGTETIFKGNDLKIPSDNYSTFKGKILLFSITYTKKDADGTTVVEFGSNAAFEVMSEPPIFSDIENIDTLIYATLPSSTNRVAVLDYNTTYEIHYDATNV